jgi:hypothetical protein
VVLKPWSKHKLWTNNRKERTRERYNRRKREKGKRKREREREKGKGKGKRKKGTRKYIPHLRSGPQTIVQSTRYGH